MRRTFSLLSFVLAASLLGGLLSAVPAAAAAPSAEPGLTTPQLIERAVQRGEVSRARGDLVLAYAFADHRRLPERFRSDAPWRGTLPLLRLSERLERAPKTAEREQAREVLAAPTSCSGNLGGLTNVATTTHFYVQYKAGTIGGGLTIGSYTASLEAARTKQVTTFGWAAPPLKDTPGSPNRYHVAIDNLGSGLYGYVSPSGTYAGSVGNNANTSWNDIDAYASCMVLNQDYSGFPSAPQASLDSTTAHEFNHSIQFGIGALTGANAAEDVFTEGGATWMEDEVFDAANDNYNYLWPTFSMTMGEYTASPYPYWVVLRAMTEPFGAGTAGSGEQVMQDFWEETSKGTGDNLTAMQAALANKGIDLGDAYHDAAIALKFNKACGGGYVYPHCLEEGPDYVAEKGATTVHKSIGSVGGSTTGSIQDNYALNWVALPTSGGTYDVRLTNTSSGPSAGGQLRASVACDMGSALVVSELPTVVGTGASTTLSGFDPSACGSRVLVITNQSQTAANPSTSTARSYSVSVVGPRILTVSTGGTGTGSVASSPAGISCPGTCSSGFADGQLVTLTATPSASSSFAGWSGACSGTGSCQVTMDAARSVTATFALNTYQLTVSRVGNGSVASSAPGIACPTDCTETYNHGTSVTLTPTADSGWVFTGWSGACSGTGACVVSMTEARSVTATFAQLFTVSVSRDGAGTGTVTSTPAGISCGSTCEEQFQDGTALTLTATPNAASVLTSWSGCDSAEGEICSVAVNGAEAVTATFGTGFLVDVEVTGGGVVTDEGSFSCDATCSDTFPSDTTVTFTATEDPGSEFIGWTGDAASCSASPTCPILMNGPKTVGATFNDPPGTPSIVVSQPFVRQRPFPVSWSADDAETYDLSVRAAPYHDPFGAPQLRQDRQPTSSMAFFGKNGHTYCFDVAAYDDGDLSSQRTECTAVPANDRALSASSGWSRRTGSGFYRGTFSVARRRGQRLVLRNVEAQQLALIATKCPRCGKVKVYFGGVLQRTIDLRASTTRKNRLLTVADFGTVDVGNVRIVVVSDGKPVKVEGFGISRV